MQSTRENDASHLCCIPFHFGFSSSTSQRNSFCVGSLRPLSTTNSSFTVCLFFFSFKRFHLRSHSHPGSLSFFLKNPTKPPARPICRCDRRPSDLEGGASVKVRLFSPRANKGGAPSSGSSSAPSARQRDVSLLFCFFVLFTERKEQLVERVPPFPFRGHLLGGGGGGTHTVCRSDKQCASAPALHA